MIPKPLDAIKAADILALVENREEERRTIDFKRELPGNADKDKAELRADVSSFANASGGDLIFGVSEETSAATAVPGLPNVDADSEIRRIESVIQSGVDPRVPGVDSRKIDMAEGGPVIVVRVPKSWRGPHFVKINDNLRMYGRNSKGKYIFDSTEIRSAFAPSEQLPERIRRWRDDRLAKVIGGDTPVPLGEGGRLCIHLLPLASFAGGLEFAASELDKLAARFPPPSSRGFNHRYNLDGVVTFLGPLGGAQQCHSYCQLFRSGRIEAVEAGIVGRSNTERLLAGMEYETELVRAVRAYVAGLEQLSVLLPIVLLTVLSGVKGARMSVNQIWMESGGVVDRDILILPEALIEDYRTDIPTLLRPVFDAVWNAAGWERSLNYDPSGNWKPRY